MGSIDGVGGLTGESSFRRVVMQTERYLTADQLNSLVLLTDKSSDGHIDFQEFTERFGAPAGTRAPLRVPGGSLPHFPIMLPEAPCSEEEVTVVAARTASILEKQGFAAERVPSLLALWSFLILENTAAAALLAQLPLSLSRREAEALLLAAGSILAIGPLLLECQKQGIWKARCAWAASNINGPALRTILQRQVAEMESRSLEPGDFARVLQEAGVAPAHLQPAMWLAEKSSQGEIRLHEYLANFGGGAPASPEAKKKRGMWSRFMGR